VQTKLNEQRNNAVVGEPRTQAGMN
jgi:hypothetical protein